MTKLIIEINGKKEFVGEIEPHLQHIRNNHWKKCPLITSTDMDINLNVYLEVS